MDDLEKMGRRQDLNLRWLFAFYGLGAMTVQLFFAAIIFWRYGSALRWHIPESVVSAYLGATVVQVVGIVLVMTKSLFPERKD